MELKWTTCLRAGVTAGILFLLAHYWQSVSALGALALGAAQPLLLGCAIAYVVNIAMSAIERRLPAAMRKARFCRPLAMAAAYLAICLALVLLVRMILPELIACVQLLLEQVPAALQAALLWLEQNTQLAEYLNSGALLQQLQSIDWRSLLSRTMQLLTSGVGGAMGAAVNVVGRVFSSLVTFVVALIFSFYLLAGKEQLARQCNALLHRFVPARVHSTLLAVLRTLNQCFRSFIVGQCTEAVILGLLCMGGMMLLRLPYAGMIGCLVGFTALIPIAGAYIGAVVGAFMIFTENPLQALIFVVFLLILQQLEGNLIYPRVVGSSIGLPGIWVLAAVTVGGGVLGIGGMLLGVPLAAAAYQLLREQVRRPAATAPENAMPPAPGDAAQGQAPGGAAAPTAPDKPDATTGGPGSQA